MYLGYILGICKPQVRVASVSGCAGALAGTTLKLQGAEEHAPIVDRDVDPPRALPLTKVMTTPVPRGKKHRSSSRTTQRVWITGLCPSLRPELPLSPFAPGSTGHSAALCCMTLHQGRPIPPRATFSFPSSATLDDSFPPARYSHRLLHPPVPPVPPNRTIPADLDERTSTLFLGDISQHGAGIQAQGRQLARAAARREAGSRSRGARCQSPAAQCRRDRPGHRPPVHPLRGTTRQGGPGDEREAHMPVARR